MSTRCLTLLREPCPIPMIVTCTKCQIKLSVDERLAGGQVRCPKCQTVFTAPASEAVPASAVTARPLPLPSPPANPPHAAEPDDVPLPRRRRDEEDADDVPQPRRHREDDWDDRPRPRSARRLDDRPRRRRTWFH